MGARPTIRRRLFLGMLGFVVLSTLTMFAFGYYVHEAAERLVWSSQLDAEVDRFLERRLADPDWRPAEGERLDFFIEADGDGLPEPLRHLSEGLHDEVAMGDREYAVMVTGQAGRRVIVALDISELESQERRIMLQLAALSLLAMAVLAPVLLWWLDRLLRPMSRLSASIADLPAVADPDAIQLSQHASAELALIAESLRGYVRRQAEFIQREREFIDSASHELRTPVAVMTGAAELLVQRADLPDPARSAAERILAAARFSAELISLLLVLAKSPDRLVESSEWIGLEQLLPDIIEDHRHLLQDRQLDIELEVQAGARVFAPLPVLRAALGNLLRNAIEQSDRGTIRIAVSGEATVQIDDPGRGMAPEEISAIYSRLARAGQREGQGIGLDLIGRLCRHLGWDLSLASADGGGTSARLALGRDVRRRPVM